MATYVEFKSHWNSDLIVEWICAYDAECTVIWPCADSNNPMLEFKSEEDALAFKLRFL